MSKFGDAFKSARKKGKKEFSFTKKDGSKSKYHTKTREETKKADKRSPRVKRLDIVIANAKRTTKQMKATLKKPKKKK